MFHPFPKESGFHGNENFCLQLQVLGKSCRESDRAIVIEGSGEDDQWQSGFSHGSPDRRTLRKCNSTKNSSLVS